jgi:sugar (pentulose or hexulose) kinase
LGTRSLDMPSVAYLRPDGEPLVGESATIPVVLPDLRTEVRLTRAELEDRIRPALLATIETLRRALRSAQVEAGDLDAVLLVGGSSRIPMVAELVADALGRPVAVDVHPKHAVALGAARLAPGRPVAVPLPPPPVPPAPALPPTPAVGPTLSPPGWAPPPLRPPAPLPPAHARARRRLVAGSSPWPWRS